MTSVRTNTSSHCHRRARRLRGTIGHRRLVCGCGPALQRRVILWRVRGSSASQSEYEGVGLRAVRPYSSMDFYRRVFQATELERHTTPTGGAGHAPLRVGEDVHRDRASTRMRAVAVLSVCHALGFGCASPMSTRRMPVHGRRRNRGRTLRPPARLACGGRLRSVRRHLVASSPDRVAGSEACPGVVAGSQRGSASASIPDRRLGGAQNGGAERGDGRAITVEMGDRRPSSARALWGAGEHADRGRVERVERLGAGVDVAGLIEQLL